MQINFLRGCLALLALATAAACDSTPVGGDSAVTSPRWIYPDVFRLGDLVAAGGRVLISAPGGVVGIDAETGAEAWVLEMPVLGFSSAALHAIDGIGIVGPPSGGIRALRLSDGMTLWSAPGTARAFADDGVRLFASVNAEIVAFDLATGRPLWRSILPIQATYLQAGEDVVCAAQSITVVCLDSESGIQIWRRTLNHGILFEGFRLFPSVLVLATTAGLYGLDVATGSTRWLDEDLPTIGSILAGDGEIFFCSRLEPDSDTFGICRALDPLTAAERWAITFQGVPRAVAICRDDVYVVSGSGLLGVNRATLSTWRPVLDAEISFGSVLACDERGPYAYDILGIIAIDAPDD